jgi:pyridoxal phosphate-dependent aminotransferase EpsN
LKQNITAHQSSKRIYLSPPHAGENESKYVQRAIESNWIAPTGPDVDAFEAEMAARIGLPYAVALSSGTAAIHLALRHLGVKQGEEVYVSTLTFIASANPILYEGGRPVFIDSEPMSWNMDPNLLEEDLEMAYAKGRLPRAVICVNLYGQCADLARIRDICNRYEIPLIEDAAEALGASCHDASAGSYGWANIFSFNGNKIITTSGGGMMLTADKKLADSVRFLSQQARDPAPHYQHSVLGYNYRMSNLLAAVGRAQLETLESRVTARRRNFDLYKKMLGKTPGVSFMPEASYGRTTRWLTCLLIDRNVRGVTPEDLRLALEAHNIESRPIWKPLHLQPLFHDCRSLGGGVSEDIFQRGLCLPSGSDLKEEEVARVSDIVSNIFASR